MDSSLLREEIRPFDGHGNGLVHDIFVTGRPLRDVLLHTDGGNVTSVNEQNDDEMMALEVLGEELGLPVIRRDAFPVQPADLGELSAEFCRTHHCLPGLAGDGAFMVVCNDPLNLPLLDALLRVFGPDCSYFLGLAEEIAMAFDHLYPQDDGSQEDSAGDMDLDDRSMLADESDPGRLRDLAREASVVRKVDWCINAALDAHASDIHFEPTADALDIRFRVDGILHVKERLPKSMQPALLSRLKLMANLDIAERRLPQDGQILWKSLGRTVDVRVSTTPAVYGESVVLRLLESRHACESLEGLGMGQVHAAQLEALGRKTHGMVLVVGPTGSGKTTTLHALLCGVRDETRKIMTVEDPVEYHIDGVSQVQVNPRIDLTFASALRSFLRQDPDVLLVGEIRDPETAHIAVQAALTGHLLLSTLHTKDAPSAVTRLRDLGVESYLLADSLLAVLGQRLVRLLCPRCRTARPSSAEERRRLMAMGIPLSETSTLFDPGQGACTACGGTAWAGREGIYELLLLDEALRRAIIGGEDAGALAALGRTAGYEEMRVAGMRKVMQGRTTLGELVRVLSVE